jgi:hypothetical protein
MLQKEGFEILLASPFYHERLVAEIYFDGKFVATVIQDRGLGLFDLETSWNDRIESQVVRRVDLDGFMQAVQTAREALSQVSE